MINMKKAAMYCVTAAALTLALSGSALAQAAGKATIKTIAENDKLVVIDGVTKPGEVTPLQSRDGWVYHYVTGGKVERTYSDGSKDVVTRKAGETLIINEKRPYSAKNIGTTTVHSIFVHLK